MGKKPVYTFAKWRVKEGQLAAVLSQLAELMAKSTAEEGRSRSGRFSRKLGQN